MNRAADWLVEEHVTPDQVRIALHRLGPRHSTPVLLVPGTFSNHTFWLGTRGIGFARELVAAGFEACVLDPRGHGRSQRPARRDRWNFDDWARQDIPTALRVLTGERRRPLIVGHSAGGAATLAALVAEPDLRVRVRGVVTVATPLPRLQPWRGIGARAIRAVARLSGRFPARLLRLGPEDELPGIMTQWMTWNIEGHWTGNDGSNYEEGLRRLERPLLSVAAAGDRLFAPLQACRGLHDLIESPDKTFMVCGRGTGFSCDFDHVSILVGKEARAEVWPLLIRWLGASR